MLVLVGPKNFKKVKDNVWVSQQISDEVEIAMSHKNQNLCSFRAETLGRRCMINIHNLKIAYILTYLKETLLNLNHGKLVPPHHDIRIVEAQSKMVVLTHGTDTMIEVNIFTD